MPILSLVNDWNSACAISPAHAGHALTCNRSFKLVGHGTINNDINSVVAKSLSSATRDMLLQAGNCAFLISVRVICLSLN